ncbi:MAG: YhcN/YlaJ family sporulation lipoprotein [Clostridia bacterium]|nr:YhcN/YlaJ family sporulation lipoprotein [Clostridia bacterium]MDE7215288.1 YhcN/YlaJ family sporulation lipoprotein [Clostridia bacterium]MDE7336811.1 YhcN/YlaJ family sporulation lipoprotein [Clostridia bacterium]
MIDIDLNYCNNVAMVDEEQALQGVESIVSQNSMVDYCIALVWKNRALVGVIPKPLFSRTQRVQLEDQIKQSISEVYGFEEVLVSFDMDIIHEISKLNKKTNVDNKEIETLFYSVKVRR